MVQVDAGMIQWSYMVGRGKLANHRKKEMGIRVKLSQWECSTNPHP
jgi:hypothetical protein